MLADAWHTLYARVRQHSLGTTGIYARSRHPQYVAFFI
jgi:protein-S-isoprenylcysteine O-methyltransferase Ste14